MSDEPTTYTLKLSDVELGRYRVMAEQARAAEADLWALAGLTTGARVADVGCGPGAMLPVLSESVGPTGSVIAVDGDPDAVAHAAALVSTAGLGNVTTQAGRADDTGIDLGSLDMVMMRHVLAHNGGREQAIVDHLAALVRPGGAVLLVDIDMPAFRVRPIDPDLEDLAERYLEFHRHKGNDIQVGLRIADLLAAAGLEVLAFRGSYQIFPAPPGMRPPSWAARDAMVDAGLATAQDVQRWDDALTRGAQRPTMLFNPMFAAVGRKPG
jgi:2-polyprenyl-3-methyl-5-hydroxy-6-metoxy-1,4-benzoquinol methylase